MLVCGVASFDPLLQFGPNIGKNGILRHWPEAKLDHVVGRQTISEERETTAELLSDLRGMKQRGCSAATVPMKMFNSGARYEQLTNVFHQVADFQ